APLRRGLVPQPTRLAAFARGGRHLRSPGHRPRDARRGGRDPRRPSGEGRRMKARVLCVVLALLGLSAADAPALAEASKKPASTSSARKASKKLPSKTSKPKESPRKPPSKLPGPIEIDRIHVEVA